MAKPLAQKEIRLSPTTLSDFLRCPRCFWLEKVKGIKKPEGIFPTLPRGMDRVIKDYFDSYRAQGALPPELSGEEFKGTQLFPDQETLKALRNTRSGLQYRDGDGSALGGAVDEILVKGGRHIPFDYKTKGSVATQESSVKYYQLQLDCYSLLLEENRFPAADYGYLLYYSPKSVAEEGHVLFEVQAFRIKTEMERARKTFREAVSVLKGPLPQMNAECSCCNWFERLRREGF